MWPSLSNRALHPVTLAPQNSYSSPLPQSITGVVDFADSGIKHLNLNAQLPLKPGLYFLPGNSGPIELHVSPGTVAKATFQVDKVHGKSMVKMAKVQFLDATNHPAPLVFTNPTSAATAHSTCFGRFGAWIKDLVADAFLDGFTLQPNGTIAIDGEIRGLGNLLRLPIMEKIPQNQLPRINPRLGEIARGQGILASGNTSSDSPLFDLDTLVAELGKMIQVINYKLSLDTDNFELIRTSDTFKSTAAVSHVHAEAEGSGSLEILSKTAPILTKFETNIGMALTEPRYETAGSTPQQICAKSATVNARLKLGPETSPKALTGNGTIDVVGNQASVRYGPINSSSSSPLGLSIGFDDLTVNPHVGTLHLHGSGKLPEALPSFFESIELELTELGGELTLAGKTNTDDFRYTRKIPAPASFVD